MKTEPNEAAMPCHFVDPTMRCEPFAQFGLTKREHFAGLAMQGLLANPHEEAWSFMPEDTAAYALRCADALIAALNSAAALAAIKDTP